MRQQDRDRRRRDAADPRRLTDRARSDRFELLDDLVRQPRDVAKVELVGDAHRVGARDPRGVGLLAAQVALVAELDRDALERRRRSPAIGATPPAAAISSTARQSSSGRRNSSASVARRPTSGAEPYRASAALTASRADDDAPRARARARPRARRATPRTRASARRRRGRARGRSASGDRPRCPRAAAAGTRRATSACDTARSCRA